MAVVISSNLYKCTIFSNHSFFPNHHHLQTRFRVPSRISNLNRHHHHHNHHQNRRLCACQATSKPSNYEEEERRWLREEKRWLREEQRWLREEARWNNERQSLLRQISELSLQIQHLQSELDKFRKNRTDYDVEFEAAKEAALLEDKYRNQISEFSDNKSFSEFESLSLDSSDDDTSSANSSESEKKKKTKKTPILDSLRVGAEGEEVRILQETLMKLGFYSGEEDMEYSSFSTGTERAVKTWQASVGIREDGIMTAELLEQLYASQRTKSSSRSTPKVNDDTTKDAANGAPTNIREVQQTVVKKEPTNAELLEHRVFLLGENRWEDSSRLNKGNDKLISGGKTQYSAPKCLVCRGEGRLLCMECDGTGDLNIEEQFLDWAEEGAKCPYCEGLGYTVCDVCTA